jgi:hypothetical protein
VDISVLCYIQCQFRASEKLLGEDSLAWKSSSTDCKFAARSFSCSHSSASRSRACRSSSRSRRRFPLSARAFSTATRSSSTALSHSSRSSRHCSSSLRSSCNSRCKRSDSWADSSSARDLSASNSWDVRSRSEFAATSSELSVSIVSWRSSVCAVSD